VLCNHPEWAGVFGYDERTEEICVLKAPPYLDTDRALRSGGRAVVDGDLSAVSDWLDSCYQMSVTVDKTQYVINSAARENCFDRVREYLTNLEWDGVERLSGWLHSYMGTADNDYTRAIGRRWMISAVARTFRPGCKADHVLVFEGKQGIGKSSALQVLAGDEYFGDDLQHIGSKDAQQYLGGLWLIELGEMDAAGKAASATLKRFLTTAADRFRAPYGRTTIKHERRCVFAGSANLDQYLKDPTGQRRFWCAKSEWVDIAGLREVRDQLWAEAVHAYRQGELWWIRLDEVELIELARAEQAERLEEDPWESKVAEWLPSAPHRPSTADILEHALSLETGRWTKAETNRIGAIMRTLGWHSVQGVTNAHGHRARHWEQAAQAEINPFAD